MFKRVLRLRFIIIIIIYTYFGLLLYGVLSSTCVSEREIKYDKTNLCFGHLTKLFSCILSASNEIGVGMLIV